MAKTHTAAHFKGLVIEAESHLRRFSAFLDAEQAKLSANSARYSERVEVVEEAAHLAALMKHESSPLPGYDQEA